MLTVDAAVDQSLALQLRGSVVIAAKKVRFSYCPTLDRALDSRPSTLKGSLMLICNLFVCSCFFPKLFSFLGPEVISHSQWGSGVAVNQAQANQCGYVSVFAQ